MTTMTSSSHARASLLVALTAFSLALLALACAASAFGSDPFALILHSHSPWTKIVKAVAFAVVLGGSGRTLQRLPARGIVSSIAATLLVMGLCVLFFGAIADWHDYLLMFVGPASAILAPVLALMALVFGHKGGLRAEPVFPPHALLVAGLASLLGGALLYAALKIPEVLPFGRVLLSLSIAGCAAVLLLASAFTDPLTSQSVQAQRMLQMAGLLPAIGLWVGLVSV